MSWYFEQDGVSQGPLPEEALCQRLRNGELAAQTLVWQPGMDEWKPALHVKPQWLVPLAAIVPATPPSSADVPSSKPPRPKTKPLAPSSADAVPPPTAATPVEEGSKPGFFKKLFGRGKKG